MAPTHSPSQERRPMDASESSLRAANATQRESDALCRYREIINEFVSNHVSFLERLSSIETADAESEQERRSAMAETRGFIAGLQRGLELMEVMVPEIRPVQVAPGSGDGTTELEGQDALAEQGEPSNWN